MTYLTNLKVGTQEIAIGIPPEMREVFSRSISRVLTKIIALGEEMETKIYSDPQMVEVIVKTWITKAKFSDENSQEEPSILFSCLLSHFRRLPHDQWKERILGAFDQEDHEIIIDVALSYLRSTIDGPDWQVKEAHSNLMALVHLYKYLEPTVPLPTRRIVASYVMMILKRITDTPREEHHASFSPDREGRDAFRGVAYMVGCGVWFLDCIARRDDVVPWLNWLIQAGLLRIIARCDQWMEEIRDTSSPGNYDESIITMVSATLSSLCVLRSFTTLLYDELAVLVDLGLGPNDIAHPRLRSAFEYLQRTVETRMAFFTQTKDEPVRVHLSCSGPSVSFFSHRANYMSEKPSIV